MALCSSCGDTFDRDKVLCPECQEIAALRIPQPGPDPEPLTDEDVAAEMWRLEIETPWDRAHPEVQKLMIGQVASVRRALASLASKTPPTP